MSSNIADFGKARRTRTANSIDETLKRFSPLLPVLVEKGDEVAEYFNLFVVNGMELGGAELRRWCNFGWELPAGGPVFVQFSVTCKVQGKEGAFFKVDLVHKPTDVPDLDAQGSHAVAFGKAVLARLKDTHDRWSALTFHVLGEIVNKVMLSARQGRIVKFEDNEGYHLLIRDLTNKDLYLKIYLGGCFIHGGVVEETK